MKEHAGWISKKIGLDGFVLALLGMIVLAWLWPEGGLSEGGFSLSALAGYGVSFIFFFYGLRLSPEKLKAGLGKYKLHLVIHLTTFIVFPLLVLGMKKIFDQSDYEILWLGTFFLAALPSTVSSSVVMVSVAGGNMPAAIFNASISSLLGIFITPVWMKLVVQPADGDYALGSVIFKLVVQVLVPVMVGILLHAKWGGYAERNKKWLRYFDQSIILLIVYTAFCDSFDRHLFDSLSGWSLLGLILSMAGLFFLVFFLVAWVSRLFQFDRQDSITAIFCGSKKSMVHGTVMSKVLFGGTAISGIILLPLMIYHALQLIIASVLAQRMRKAELLVSTKEKLPG